MTEVDRWDVGLVAALVSIGSGILLANLVLVAGAVIGLVFALYGSVSSVPEDVELVATRQFEPAGAGPGSELQVKLDIENTGAAVLPDLRVADGVPEACPVVEGSPRSSEPLRPGETLTIEYTIVLQRGRFEFDEPVCRLRSFAGTDQQTLTLSVTGDRSLRCGAPLDEAPLTQATLQHAGSVGTDTGGSGLEFYGTRQYHHGDPMNRINWHQVAKTGEFVTVQYRQERAARTIIVMDCRASARVRHSPGYPTGGALAVYAAERIYDSLEAAGVVTTLTAIGLGSEPEPLVGPEGIPWVGRDSPKGAAAALFEAATRTAADNTGSPSPDLSEDSTPTVGTASPEMAGVRADGGPDSETALADAAVIEQLQSRVPNEAQVIICSPLMDEWVLDCTSALTARDNPCHIVSPDVTGGETTAQRIESVQRQHRINLLNRSGVSVTDWPVEYPVEYALRRTLSQL